MSGKANRLLSGRDCPIYERWGRVLFQRRDIVMATKEPTDSECEWQSEEEDEEEEEKVRAQGVWWSVLVVDEAKVTL